MKEHKMTDNIKALITGNTLREHSTLDIEIAKMRIIQIRVRPSLDVEWYKKNQEWYEHFLEKYHKTGKRYAQHYTSEDKLTRVTQIFWIDSESWYAANKTDPIVINNAKNADAHYAKHNVTQTKIREQKIYGNWYASIITNVTDNGIITTSDNPDIERWKKYSLGNMILHNPALLGNVSTTPPLLK